MSHRWIDDAAELDDLIDILVAEPRYALDTEFHRERRTSRAWRWCSSPGPDGWPWSTRWRVDPAPAAAAVRRARPSPSPTPPSRTSTCSPTPSGAVPRHLFDTQVAAGFVGYGTPSLASLLQGELGVTPAKGDRLTDWLRRPLTEAQREYAAADVATCSSCTTGSTPSCAALGRLAWVDEACEELRTRPTGATDPEMAWIKLKDARTLRPRARAVAQAVAAWREREAAATDIPVRQVLPDLAILGIAQRQPTTLDELAQSRGVDERHRRGRLGRRAARRGRRAARRATPPPVPDARRRAGPLACGRRSRWCRRGSARWPGTPASTPPCSPPGPICVAVLRGDPNARLAHGWRAELLGDGITRLIDGRAALTFDGKGGCG